MNNDDWRGPFFFIQMADPQFGMFSFDEGFEEETDLFGKAIAHANRLMPAFVVICGDLVNQAGNEEQASEFLRVAGMLDRGIPLYLAPGNHDINNEPSGDDLKWYREQFGRDWYAFGHGGCRFLVVNSPIIFDPEGVEDETEKQRRWVHRSMADSSASVQTVVFQHHSWFLTDPDEEDDYFNIPLERRREYLELFGKHGVPATFAGHYHRNAYGRYGDMEMVTSGPVGQPLGEDPSGFRIVKVFEDRIEHEYYGLDVVPERVHVS